MVNSGPAASGAGATADDGGASAGGASTRTVERALCLLGEVCSDGEITLTECARRAGVPTSTALRLLRTLEGAGFVCRRDGFFEAGPRLVQIGAQAIGRRGLVRIAEPVLREVARATGESAYLSMRGPGDVAIYVAVAEGTHSIRHTSWIGRSVPLAGTAVGMVLRGEVSAGRYVARRDRFEPDVTAIVTAVARPGGSAGALSVLGPTFRIDDDLMHRYGALVVDAANEIAAQYGSAAESGEVGE